MNTELLNAAREFIVNEANKQGVSLAEAFGTPENFKTAVISLVIISVKDIMKIDMAEAYDIVMGKGEYQRILDECWNELS